MSAALSEEPHGTAPEAEDAYAASLRGLFAVAPFTATLPAVDTGQPSPLFAEADRAETNETGFVAPDGQGREVVMEDAPAGHADPYESESVEAAAADAEVDLDLDPDDDDLPGGDDDDLPGGEDVAGPEVSRRGVFRIAGVAAATTAIAGTGVLRAEDAEAAIGSRYRPARYRRTRVPSATARHMGNRFAYGITPALNRQMIAAGGPYKWFRRQLNWQTIPDAFAYQTQTWWPSVTASPKQIVARHNAEIEPMWNATANYARWALMRRIYSNRQVLEVMAEFWENHLHVSTEGDGVHPFRADYGRVIRRHALGRFDQMLYAAVTHPAMGMFLSNAMSTKRGVNENLGRELLELHTVGRGRYTEADVKDSAKILTGFRVDAWRTWEVYYDPDSHYTGRVKVMGFSHANTNPDGQVVARAYLRYLAHHPATAQRIAWKLAIRFVTDRPSKALVDYLARVYLKNNTEIKPVLLALVNTRQFRAAAGRKVRTPTDDVVATHRVLGTRMVRPRSGDAAANSILWQTNAIGQMPFQWPRPDGMPDEGTAWSSASRVLASFDQHYVLAGGWWPRKNIAYRNPASWVPVKGMPFNQLVDHLCRVLLGRPSTARILKACCQATGTGPKERIRHNHPILRWKMPVLLTTLLDSPHHLTR